MKTICGEWIKKIRAEKSSWKFIIDWSFASEADYFKMCVFIIIEQHLRKSKEIGENGWKKDIREGEWDGESGEIDKTSNKYNWLSQFLDCPQVLPTQLRLVS